MLGFLSGGSNLREKRKMQTVNFSGGSQQKPFQPTGTVLTFLLSLLPVSISEAISNKTMWLCGVYNIRRKLSALLQHAHSRKNMFVKQRSSEELHIQKFVRIEERGATNPAILKP